MGYTPDNAILATRTPIAVIPKTEKRGLCAEGEGAFTCFTSTKVQILTQTEKRGLSAEGEDAFTCFTSTKVQILTQTEKRGLCAEGENSHKACIIYVYIYKDGSSLLALLVQKYKY
jgi:hypothetical protein